MDTGTVSPNFEDIRPLNQDEVQAAIEDLLASEEFRHALQYVKPNLDWDQLCAAMRACKTKEEFKSTLAYDAVMTVAKKTTFSLTISGRSRLPEGKPACTFISNHRDIVLDASFLNVMLYDVGYGMTQVAIGDNLLIRPWIKTFVRLNNSFIVKRGVSVRQMLEVSGTLWHTLIILSKTQKNPFGLHNAKGVQKIQMTALSRVSLRCFVWLVKKMLLETSNH